MTDTEFAEFCKALGVKPFSPTMSRKDFYHATTAFARLVAESGHGRKAEINGLMPKAEFEAFVAKVNAKGAKNKG